MRLLIRLQSEREGILSWHYHYAVSAWIYTQLRRTAPQYADYLHEQGYRLDERRRTRLFTFALHVQKAQTTAAGFLMQPGMKARLIVSTLLRDTFIQPFITSLLQDSKMVLAVPPHTTVWRIRTVEILPPPVLGDRVRAVLLSPVVVSIPGTRHPQYLSALDERVPEVLQHNALKKYRAATGTAPRGTITFAVDRQYVLQRGGDRSRSITTLHRIKVGSPDETAIRGFIAPLQMQGDRHIIEVLYDCGIGEKNSMGFGCWRPDTEKLPPLYT